MTLQVRLWDATGEMEIKGTRAALSRLADLFRGTSGWLELDRNPRPHPYDASLGRIEFEETSGLVVASASADSECLEVRGGRESLDVLAANLQTFAVEAGFNSHLHIEYLPDAGYLSEESDPLIIALADDGFGES
ncbi:hypothetical protein [Streptomyces erythrochromogenes]|uniref:Imm32 family immunity protein n=1 Tax=Streptomyces erythrochromogenes TaxID=285574 RepID=UPI003864047F|nr:hypothetical protein OG364_00915 [Streptomyces erythrochromogenes]WST98367.1 hypothetical protein OG364_40620 [Streptomyces erythrochromogenes]